MVKNRKKLFCLRYTRYMLEVDLYLVADTVDFEKDVSFKDRSEEIITINSPISNNSSKINQQLQDESLYHSIVDETIEAPINESLSKCFEKLTSESPILVNGTGLLLSKKENDHHMEIQRPKLPNGPPPKLQLPTIPPRTLPPAPPTSAPKIQIPTRIASSAIRVKSQVTTNNATSESYTGPSLNPFDMNGNSNDIPNTDENDKLCTCNSGAHPKTIKTISSAYNNVGLPPPPPPSRPGNITSCALPISYHTICIITKIVFFVRYKGKALQSFKVGDKIMVHPTFVYAADQIYVQFYPQNEDYLQFLVRLAKVHYQLKKSQDPGRVLS